jgi:hypothetical protein
VTQFTISIPIYDEGSQTDQSNLQTTFKTVFATKTQTGSKEEESAPEERFAIFSRSGQQCGLADTKAMKNEEEGGGQKKSRLQGKPSPSTHSTHNTIKKKRNLTLNKLPLPRKPKQDRKRKKWHRNSLALHNILSLLTLHDLLYLWTAVRKRQKWEGDGSHRGGRRDGEGDGDQKKRQAHGTKAPQIITQTHRAQKES